jgi:hypothetical protein
LGELPPAIHNVMAGASAGFVNKYKAVHNNFSAGRFKTTEEQNYSSNVG